MSKRAQNKANTRAAITEAARRLFAENGYANTRTRDIAAAAGIATGTLFNYAPTKEDVVLLVWKARASELAESGLASASDETDPVVGIVNIFAPILAFYAEDIELGRVFLHQATYAAADDPEMVALNEGFVARLALYLAPHAGLNAMHVAVNAFAAYYTVLTMLLAGRVTAHEHATDLLRDLLRVQRLGWENDGR